jgi:hypothetical protein
MRAPLLSAAAVVVLAAGCGGEEQAAAPAARCSASSLSPQLPKQELPPRVAATRARIAAAAVRCDYAALAAIARANVQGFTFSYGSGRSPAAYWRRLETAKHDRPLARLVKILSLPVSGNEVVAYTWPSAYAEGATVNDWDALVRGGVYSRAVVEQMKQGGVYLGYRTAISPQGRWLFFVAGD